MRDMGFGQFRDLSPDQHVLVLCRALLPIDAVRYVCTKRRRLNRAVGFAPGDSRSPPSVRVWLGICTPRTECAVRHRRATRPRSTPAQNPCRLQRGHNAVSNRTGRMGLKVLPAPQSRGSVWTQPKPGVAPGCTAPLLLALCRSWLLPTPKLRYLLSLCRPHVAMFGPSTTHSAFMLIRVNGCYWCLLTPPDLGSYCLCLLNLLFWLHFALLLLMQQG